MRYAFPWTADDTRALRMLHRHGHSVRSICERLGRERSVVHRHAKRLGLQLGEPRAHWTRAQVAEIRRRYPHETAAAIAADLGRKVGSVHQKAGQLGLKKSRRFLESDRSGRIQRGRNDPRLKATQFKKGHVPANKGVRRPGWAPGRMAETQFKKGRPPQQARNYQPIGAERYDTKRGVTIRKISDDRSVYPAKRWRPVHVIVWEAAHGPAPKGHIVRFRDGMKTLVSSEITLDRLELVTHAENMRRNTVHRYPKHIVRAVQTRAALNRIINKRTRNAE